MVKAATAITCHMSRVTCRVSHITRHMSYVSCPRQSTVKAAATAITQLIHEDVSRPINAWLIELDAAKVGKGGR